MRMYDVAIIGGGLAGLINSILLRREGLSVILFEEKSYPFQRVCGEYISNEVIPFLELHDLFPKELAPASIQKFHLTSSSGKSLHMDLDLGGFGISRFAFDHWLVKKARMAGVLVHEKERVIKSVFGADAFHLETNKDVYQSHVVIGSFGKRTRLDKDLNRRFIRKRSPYLGVKYHLKTDLVRTDAVELHNFSGGYAGISQVENGTFNLCYLSHNAKLKAAKDIPAMERSTLHKNPHLKRIFNESEFLFENPVVINEISFERKEPVFNHILMSGDSAGMITPLCGNGMAMAIHSAKILSELVIQFHKGDMDRPTLERSYAEAWKSHFSTRHWAGRKIQSLFGSAFASELGVGVGRAVRPLASYLMKQTHGTPFQ